MRHVLLALSSVAALTVAPAHAAFDIYAAALYGKNECAGTPLTCGVGDPDGFGAATVIIDNLTNTVSWTIMASGLDLPLTGAHIHFAPAGLNGPIKIDFNGALSGSVIDTDAAFITPNSFSDKYVNLHNGTYPGGAIRGQLEFVKTVNAVPEPHTYALFFAGVGVVVWSARRRREQR